MSEPSHAFLLNLLATHDTAAAHGCGLEPQLLELLLDRHSVPVGVASLNQRIRSDGPAQSAPSDLPRLNPAKAATGGHANVGR